VGTSGNDVIVGLGGNDTIQGNGGNDKICGGDGNDILEGDSGNDTLDGGSGALDMAFYGSGPGPEQVDLSAGTATGDGSDTLTGIEGAVGSQFADTLLGDAGFNLFAGLGGNDTVDGRGGGDVLAFLSATTGVTANLASGSVSTPGEGTDTFSNIGGFAGSDYNDTLTGDGGSNILLGMGGDDTLHGGAGTDVLLGGDGNDTLDGGGDLDRLYADAGNDTLDGGGDLFNVASFALVPGPVNVDLTAGTATGAGTDTLTHISAVDGSSGDDTIVGDAASNDIFAGDGNDSIFGRAGGDILDGGPGTDTIDGGDGTDTCTTGEVLTSCESGGIGVRVPWAAGAAKVAAGGGRPPGTFASSPTATLDVASEDPVVSCYYSDATGHWIWVDSPWTPHPLSGLSGETEWFIDQIWEWDPGSQTWIPGTPPPGNGWQDWAWTPPSNLDSVLLLLPWSEPWFAQGGGYLERQSWTVPAGTYFAIKAWIEWRDPAGNVEGHVYDWIRHVFSSDGTGPWCRY
jgi:hypothetical protein